MKLSEALQLLGYQIVDYDPSGMFVAKLQRASNKPKYEILSDIDVLDDTPVTFVYRYLVYNDTIMDIRNGISYKRLYGNLFIEDQLFDKYGDLVKSWIENKTSLVAYLIFRTGLLNNVTSWYELVEKLNSKSWSVIIEVAAKISDYLKIEETSTVENNNPNLEID